MLKRTLLDLDLSNSLGAPQSWTRAARTAAPITIFAVGGRDLGCWGGSTALITQITVSVSDLGYWGGSIERVDLGGVMQTRVKRRTTCFQHTVELIETRSPLMPHSSRRGRHQKVVARYRVVKPAATADIPPDLTLVAAL